MGWVGKGGVDDRDSCSVKEIPGCYLSLELVVIEAARQAAPPTHDQNASTLAYYPTPPHTHGHMLVHSPLLLHTHTRPLISNTHTQTVREQHKHISTLTNIRAHSVLDRPIYTKKHGQ